MLRPVLALLLIGLLTPASVTVAQTTYRVRGTVRDNEGKPVAGVRVRSEALTGFRGEQFVGQKEFEVTTNAKGEWVILGLTSGIWAFEATGPDVIPQVVLLPINFTARQPQSARGGSFPWDLPLWVRRTSHERLAAAAAAAVAKKTDEALTAISMLASDPDPDVLCASGELALLIRQFGLANAIFEQAIKQQPKHGCSRLGLASAALMQNNHDRAAKMLWAAIDLAPREQRPALGAAIKDLQQVTGTK